MSHQIVCSAKSRSSGRRIVSVVFLTVLQACSTPPAGNDATADIPADSQTEDTTVRDGSMDSGTPPMDVQLPLDVPSIDVPNMMDTSVSRDVLDTGILDANAMDAVSMDAFDSAMRDATTNDALTDSSVADGGIVPSTTVQQAYLKASNTSTVTGVPGDYFGGVLAMSADGNTLVVGAVGEDSNATGINGSQTNDGATDSGAVYVFRRTGTTWSQEAYLKASNTGSRDLFGVAVALSADGNVLVVGARGEDSNAVGVNGNQSSNLAIDSGAAYVFRRTGTTWSQEAYLKASNPEDGDRFGINVTLSSDGTVLAVAADREGSNARGVNGSQTNNLAVDAGAVYVFRRGTSTWAQEAYLKASNTDASDFFGGTLALSGDGVTLAVGANLEDSAATTVNGSQSDNSALDSGAVYVFRRGTSVWSQDAYIKASNAEADDYFGVAVSLSNDGRVLAVGANRENGASRGANGDPMSNGAANSGAAYIFRRGATTWAQEAYLKASNSEASDEFGINLLLNSDASLLFVGARYESSQSPGINGNGNDNSMFQSGASYTFRSVAGQWLFDNYVKASNPGMGDQFGYSLASSATGTTFAIGAYGEASVATGINGNQLDNSVAGNGAAYVFTR